MSGTLDENQSSDVLRRNPVQPYDGTGQKRRFWHVRSTSGGIIRTAEQAPLFA
jgi:hypothetical protein